MSGADRDASAPDSPWHRLDPADRWRLAGLVAAAAMAYSLASWLRHWHFGSSGWDLGIEDQAVWQMSRFEWPFSSFQDIPFFADHFNPILVGVVPLYWFWPRPETLLAVQALALAVAVVPVFLFARGRLPGRLPWVIAVAYVFFWGVQRAVLFEFHELALAAPLVGWAVIGMEQRRWRLLGVMLAGLLLVKEDLPFLVVGFGGLLVWRGHRMVGALAIAGGLAALAAILLVWFPAMSRGGPWEDAPHYRALLDPMTFVADAVREPRRLELLVMYVAPWVFLPLASPISVAAVPLVMSRLVSTTPQHWMAAFHYTAPLAPLLAIAAADGWARLRAADAWRRPVRTRAIGTVMLLVCILQPGSESVLKLLWPPTYQFQTWERAVPDVQAVVPAEASLVIQDALAPHFSQRPRIYTLDAREREAEFVVACRHADTWPNPDWPAVERLLDRWRSTHEVVFHRDGWIVLRARTP